MDFGFNEEQEMLRKTARDFLSTECPKTLVREMEEDERGYSVELWRKMADLGWLGLIIPEAYGGLGMSFLELAVLLEEVGRALLPGPFFSTVIFGAVPLLLGGSEEQKRTFLPKIASGETIFTSAITEPSASYSHSSIVVKGEASGENWIINGTKLFVPDANVADYILCVARTGEESVESEGVSIFIVASQSPGLSIVPLKTIADDKQCEVGFDKVSVPRLNLVGQLNKGWSIVGKVLKQASVAKSCEMLGGAQQVLDMTVSYAKERTQFGRPIGSFQAIQHHCANMMIDVEASRFIVYQAAWMVSQGLPCDQEVSIAKAWVSDAYRRVTALGHQVHGAVGFTKDHDMQLYYRRAKAAELNFGDADFHRELVAKGLGF
jgi:alkylation response protein AidB-like acyl-CoA dehydrogenase